MVLLWTKRIKTKQYLQSTVHNGVRTVKKWLWISGFVILMVIGVSLFIYMKAMEPLNEAEEMATNIAKEEASIETVQNFSIYNGTQTYYIIQGKASNGKNMIVWIPEKEKNRKIVVKEAKKGVSQEEAKRIVEREKSPQEIKSVKLGMENNIPLWEIYYSSNEDSISYYYIDFDTGKMLKDIENL